MTYGRVPSDCRQKRNRLRSAREPTLKASSTEPFDTRATAGFLIRRLQQIVTSVFYEQIQGFDITISQYAALWAVEQSPGIDQLRLGRLTSLDRSTIGTAVDGLKRRGLIITKISASDRRYKNIYPAAKGTRLLQGMEPAVRGVQEKLLAALPERERRTFMDLLAKLVHLNSSLSRVPTEHPVIGMTGIVDRRRRPGARAVKRL